MPVISDLDFEMKNGKMEQYIGSVPSFSIAGINVSSNQGTF